MGQTGQSFDAATGLAIRLPVISGNWHRQSSNSAMITKSINYWSLPGGLEGSLDVYEAMRLAKEHGFEGIEFGIADSGALHLGTTEEECKAIKAKAVEMGLST